MIIDRSPQGSEAWERVRKGKATASEFSRIITPAQLKFAAGASSYACQVAAELLGVESPPPPPSYWMERGTEMEPFARQEFKDMTGLDVAEVGFIMPHEGARYGCSLDGLLDGETLEIKCPAVETLIQWHYDGVVPKEYRLQIQGGLWITKLKRCNFFAWHPEVEPLLIRVERCEKTINALAEAMPRFNTMVDEILSKIRRRSGTVVFNKLDAELEGFDD
jgi:hypothetical protein